MASSSKTFSTGRILFQRIFGTEDHKPALLGFLNDLLELDDSHRIDAVSLLPPE
jgi:predicted transposase/invertase (TIGR01784 family)